MNQDFQYIHTPYNGEVSKPELVNYLNRQLNDIALALSNVTVKLNQVIQNQRVNKQP